MHLQVSTKRYKDKVYKYARIVQSVRDENGKSTQRIIKNLGRMSDELIDAMRVAVKAVNDNKKLVIGPELSELLATGTIVANRSYLELAVLRECWTQWKLGELFDELDPASDTVLTLAEVILPLVVQRCVAPSSKLGAVRWMHTTALPEMLAIQPRHFNNTRVHRALEQLHEIEQPLQTALVKRYIEHDGQFVSLFADVTDTHFEGIGPEMAEQTRTKKDIPNKRCLSIGLLANQHGFPMEWHTMGGKTKDWANIRELICSLQQRGWLEQAPLVMDRTMGNPANIAWLKQQRIRFLTAAHVSSIDTYTSRLETSHLDDVEVNDLDEAECSDEELDENYEDNIERVAQAARDAGLTEIHERLFVVDLEVQVAACELPKQSDQLDAPTKKRPRGGTLFTQLTRALSLREERLAEQGMTHKELGQRHGISAGRVGQLLTLTRLCEQAQQRILERGPRVRLSEKKARALTKRTPEDQLAAIDEATVEELEQSEACVDGTQAKSASPHAPMGELAMAAYFNPRLFVDIRLRTQRHLRELHQRVDELNAELRNAKRSRRRDPTYNKLSRELRRRGYLRLFDIELEPLTLTSAAGNEINSFQFKLTRNEEQWRQRRQYDGYVLLLAHPQIERSAVERVQLYRAKDAVEKDFQVIKSLVRLRPVFHYTDVKVRAHITVCMLALLLERTLRKRLADAGLDMSARACIEHLQTTHLNERHVDEHRFFDLTRTTPMQQRILESLDLQHLADQDAIAKNIAPRQ